jgi:glycosyltransferase involved in cell wall biosynthesis
MRISGFSFARNAEKLYYPITESIRSALPIVDEFVVIYCPGDEDDHTLELLKSIGDPKLRVIERPWPSKEEAGVHVFSFLTNAALDLTSGDWCLYLQADEVIHEDDLPAIKGVCERALGDRRVDALLFDFLHFWGDYRHVQKSHAWYKREIRIVRNGIDLRSKGDAQSFRFRDGRKPVAAHSGARVFHYGWVRPPRVMKSKTISSDRIYHGDGTRTDGAAEFDYGPLGRLAVFGSSHPAVMKERIDKMDWAHTLREADPPGTTRALHKDERFKYRFLTAVENFTGLDLGHKNYRKIIHV